MTEGGGKFVQSCSAPNKRREDYSRQTRFFDLGKRVNPDIMGLHDINQININQELDPLLGHHCK
jgi:hypothetical protein